MQRPNAMQIAREFAALARQDEDTNFTAMKLQKLLYYAQAWCLHERGLPLFDERIKAWENGPVLPEVFQRFKHLYRVDPNGPELGPPSDLSDDDRELVFGVWQLFKRFTGDDLSDLTHEYAAWNRARQRASRLFPSPEIRKEDMSREIREYLRQQEEQIHSFIQGLHRS
jgi:uncharacterized phage-associated protein